MDRKLGFLAVILVAGVGLLLLSVFLLAPSMRQEGGVMPEITRKIPKSLTEKSGTETFSKFASEEEFRKYLEESQATQSFGGFETGLTSPIAINAPAAGVAEGTMGFKNALSAGGVSSEYSTTNVQVAGIDEPDIVKTDGKHIYFSRESRYQAEPMLFRTEDRMMPGAEPEFLPRNQLEKETAIVAALPADTMKKLGSMTDSGEMLLFGDILVIFENSRRDIVAYDISDRSNPKRLWDSAIRDNGELVLARNHNGILYLAEKSWVDNSRPCPLIPLSVGDKEIAIACTDIYRSSVPSSADAVFTVLAIDPVSGGVKSRVSFVGSVEKSVAYMSENAVYITFPRMSDPIKYLLGFFKENEGLLPSGTIEKLDRLAGYDLSPVSKMIELESIVEKAFLGMSGDDRLKLENEMQNRMAEYGKQHLRELEFTSIAKVSVPDLEVEAGGRVPGRLLNQFSLDEYEGDLRVATTVGGRGGFFGGRFGGRSTTSSNDVYVLDDELRVTGALLDLGQGERIYSARFVGETGYLVTFRETDPFFVLDLSDPAKPRKAGELKIPGYSSYLHPLDDKLVLGIGKEDANVKLSLFDVSNPDQPEEVSKYILDEYWSEAVSNHHAFLADFRHETFFLPGSQGGYVFSYAGDTLSLKKAARDTAIKRALFIGDTFYIVSEEAIYAYNKETWEKIGELSF